MPAAAVTGSSRPPLGDLFPIGYYREDDLPVLSALAQGYTTFDNYFCSMMGPTCDNRLFQLTGTTELDEVWGDFPPDDERRPIVIPTTIFDRVREAGLSTADYYFGESDDRLVPQQEVR